MRIYIIVNKQISTFLSINLSVLLSRAKNLITAGIALVLFTACASQTTTADGIDQVVQDNLVQEREVAPLDGMTVYSVLAAEMALADENFELALGFYLSLARETKDINAAQRVVAISQIIGAFKEMLEGSLIWQEADQENPIAFLAQAQSLLKMNRILEIAEPINKIIELEPEFPLEKLFSDNDLVSAESALDLDNLFKQLVTDHPDNAGLQLANATNLLRMELWIKASNAATSSLKLRTTVEGYTVLARANEQIDGPESAAAIIKKGLKHFPTDRRLTAQFARLISSLEQPDKALPVMEEYYRANPDDHPMISMYGRIALETGEMNTARRLYENLLDSPATADEANYFLGTIAYENDRLEAAIDFFREVQPSNYFAAALASRIEIIEIESGQKSAIEELENVRLQFPTQAEGYRQLARLYYNSEQYHLAIDVLNNGLGHLPNHQSLLYSRALALDLIGQHTDAISDLRQVLGLDPDNVMALNALGYTLADNSIDLPEAWKLIQKAYALNSEDPAIIDSMGWIQYRRGEFTEAERYLSTAFEKTKNHEIAAHLGEVLWIMNRHDEAEKIWLLGLEDKPDSSIIIETQKRLKGI